MLIAQISDTHITRAGETGLGGADPAASLRRAAAYLNGLRPAPDAVLVTGDLAHGGADEEYAEFRAALSGLEPPHFVIPGNHDDREALRRAFADDGYLPRTGEFLHYTVESLPLRLVGLDTLIPGALGGEMCEKRLAWLDQQLAAAPETPTMVFMHHPPFSIGVPVMDAMQCAGGEALGGVIARHPQVERVVCGHVHRPVQIRWHGTVACTAPSIAAQLSLSFEADAGLGWSAEPSACLLHAWLPEGRLVTHVCQIGDFA